MTTAFVPHDFLKRQSSSTTTVAGSTCSGTPKDGAAHAESADGIYSPAGDKNLEYQQSVTAEVKATLLGRRRPNFDLVQSGYPHPQGLGVAMSRAGSESEGSFEPEGGVDGENDPLLTGGDGESRSSKESDPELRNLNNSSALYRPRSDAFNQQTDIIQTSTIREDPENPLFDLQAPIKGFEVMEARAKFTVYKIHVQRGPEETWFVFRRYTDFVRINRELGKLFPGFRLALPPKRWFRDNFDSSFLEDRMLGLQAFVNNILGHREISQSVPVREFFCVDDPPGPHDSLEESRTMCENIQDELYNLHKDVQERDVEIDLLHDELEIYKSKVETLEKELRRERERNRRRSPNSIKDRESMISLTESDRNSCTEVDQEECDTKATKDSSGAPTAAELGHIPEISKKLESIAVHVTPTEMGKKMKDIDQNSESASVSYKVETKKKKQGKQILSARIQPVS